MLLWGVPLLVTTAAYVFDWSTIVKPSWVISATWEAFWVCVRCVLPPVGTIAWALVVVVLLVVPAVPFFAEVGVFECMNVGDMDTFSWFELVKLVCQIGRVADEV